MNSWHILSWVSAGAGAALFALAWLVKRKSPALPSPSKDCQRRGPEAVTK